MTHLEPVSARKIFPCFDEPEYKAFFNLKVTHHKNFTVLSNTKIVNQTIPDENSRIITSFETTPEMSTYNLAFFMSNFSASSNHKNGHTIFARPNAIHNVEFAFKIEDQIFKKFEELTTIPYKFDKMDLVAVPKFLPSAMENWGLILFKERSLFYDPEFSTSLDKMNVATTISHEYAHQWFGNLVSCRWSDLWLKEGLASFFAQDILIEVRDDNFHVHRAISYS